MSESIRLTIRLILSAVLIYFVFKETGWATATAIGLLTLGNELEACIIKQITKQLKEQ